MSEFEFRLSVTSIFRSQYPVLKAQVVLGGLVAARGITIRTRAPPVGGNREVHNSYIFCHADYTNDTRKEIHITR